MSTERRTGTLRDAATWAVLLAASLALVASARLDRTRIRPALLPGPDALPLPRPPGLPEALLRSQAELETAAEEMRAAGAAADRARRELEQVRADIDRRQEDLRALKDDADAQADRTKRDLEEARSRLDEERDNLERTAAAAERRVRAAQAEMARLAAERAVREREAAAAAASFTMQEAERLASRGVPPRPNATQLDPVSGDIAWPEALRDAEYRDRTADVERHFRDRAAAGEIPGVERRRSFEAALDDLADRLRANVSRHPASQYGPARTFLDSLRREYGLPPERR